jgi:hypothetical protein
MEGHDEAYNPWLPRLPTASGKGNNRNNVRRRVLVRAADLANTRIDEQGHVEQLPSSSRRTICDGHTRRGWWPKARTRRT